MEITLGLDIIIKAKTEERDDRIHRQWCSILPHMTEETFVSFAEYRDNMIGANIDHRSDAEILAEIDEIEREFAREG